MTGSLERRIMKLEPRQGQRLIVAEASSLTSDEEVEETVYGPAGASPADLRITLIRFTDEPFPPRLLYTKAV